MPGQGAKMFYGFRTLGFLKLDPVTDPEFRVALWIMAIPLAQLRGRSNLLAPFVEVGLLLAQPPRPEPIHQHTLAIPRADSS